jgi:hypothetical protein
MEGIVAILFLILFVILVSVLAKSSQRLTEAEERRKELEERERRRVKACGEVVMFFANHLGYIARECISREELEALIDAGITKEALAQEITSRIAAKEGLVLGYHLFGEWKVDVKLPTDFRERHVYVVGKSGAGKTNLLRNLIFQDIEAGSGVGVIAPEQEMLTEEILPYIPEHRIDDVIYFNPADTEAPVTFNPLQLEEGEDIDLKVDENFTTFKRVVGETGPRIDEIVRQGLYALMEIPESTLLDFERLLDRGDPTFRNKVIRRLKDPNTVHFWRDVYPQYPKDAHLPVTSRINKFTRPKAVRNVLCNPRSNINFREAMDEGKILCFNLSDGILGETNSQILGQLIVAKFQMATMSRANLPKPRRKPFYLYIDEFQTFTDAASVSYEKILSRSRKYKLGLILAHQQTGQIPSELLREIFGNVSTMISFNISQTDAAKLSKEFITEYNGQVVSIPQEEFLRLKVGQAWVKIGRHAFFMHTRLADQRPDDGRARRILERSRANYGLESLPLAEDGSGRPESQEPQAHPSKDAGSLLKDIDPKKVW